MGKDNSKLYAERVNRIKTAIALGQPDRVPVAPFFDGVATRLMGSSYADQYYNFEKASEAAINFVKKYPNCDAMVLPMMSSGLANEIAGTVSMDWPGRPGGRVDKYSTQQIIENVFMEQDEYPELLKDYTGFMLNKFIPRAFPNLKGFAGVNFMAPGMDTRFLAPLTSPEFLESVKLLERIAEENAKAGAASFALTKKAAEMGYPGMITGAASVPYDIIGDYFRGTMGIFEDIVDEDVLPYVEEAIEMFTEMQIKKIQGMKHIPLPLRTCFFALHKGMDGFMSDKQYEKLYWEPLKKIILALIDIDVTPYVYTEGPYNTRLEYLADVTKGKVLYGFETADLKKIKEIVGKTSCIVGNLSVSKMEFSTKESIIHDVRELLDICAPGGGYIFDFDGSLENAKEENLDAMFETLAKYGNY